MYMYSCRYSNDLSDVVAAAPVLPGVAAHSMFIGAAASLPRRALRARHGARQSLATPVR